MADHSPADSESLAKVISKVDRRVSSDGDIGRFWFGGLVHVGVTRMAITDSRQCRDSIWCHREPRGKDINVDQFCGPLLHPFREALSLTEREGYRVNQVEQCLKNCVVSPHRRRREQEKAVSAVSSRREDMPHPKGPGCLDQLMRLVDDEEACPLSSGGVHDQFLMRPDQDTGIELPLGLERVPKKELVSQL